MDNPPNSTEAHANNEDLHVNKVHAVPIPYSAYIPIVSRGLCLASSFEVDEERACRIRLYRILFETDLVALYSPC